ncbi:hypothetical protein [Sphingomonas sp. CARO-RG-8B-R24-01]|uniref:hypothetical protein n=1 Tax=Sphingomonas sp. CARO-RG-8B-R24-01 TaxID=2914831 RepID=UPI001F57E890|nr:hypothetical protein [Sphingomonas sp. CARO-RG-8B-R24-01]
MTEAFAKFEYAPSVDRLSMKEWRWGKPLLFQVSVTTLAQLYGPVGDQTPDQVVRLNRAQLNHVATRKTRDALMRPSEPVTLEQCDFAI